MLFTNASMYACNFINNVPLRSTTYTHYFPDKRAGYNGGKLTSKQTLIKMTNSGTTIKDDRPLIKLIKQLA